ncbi:class I SAM-dependent methyltransferase [Ruegeria sp. 6PALISEP08]|uniref:class I SAM-dependent methyltransferase n=1 Tax=Ruegeria sp. 6PALISEP08 TaxID=1225660 RepID=UPI000AF22B94|nr:class I SAM-dependent methyltransferase [Ruegeria sp. 6PALISEP08]
MEKTTSDTTLHYDTAAPKWRDKMRTLGYYDAYLRFLSAEQRAPEPKSRVVDIGAGTASFAEAWVAIHGPPSEMTLLEPSHVMVKQGQDALRARGVEPSIAQGMLGSVELKPADVALAAHVIEHCPDALNALEQIRDLLRPGGRLYLVVSKPHWCNAIIWLQWRHRTFRKEQILGLLEKAGFTCDREFSFPAGPPSRTSRGILAHRRV